MRPIPLENPPNPWQSSHVEYLGEPPVQGLSVYQDQSRSILAENDSPDLGFRYSLNPYRGCQHGCAYCYARPSHEYLGFGSGSDFERRILVKLRAPELLREAFMRQSWRGELILVSGNTDCYQPLEASYGLTRGCLAVMAEFRNPAHVITKSALIERDIDLLQELERNARVGVSVSVPFWDADQARAIEPYAPAPARRIRAIAKLAGAGIDVVVNVAPVIPGLTDRDIPKILSAAADAGASSACLIMLRLPKSVAPIFQTRLERSLPLSAAHVLSRTREVRGGKLNDARFGSRMRGEGEYADAIRALFDKSAARLGLTPRRLESEPRPTTFRRPEERNGQLWLF